MLALDFLVPLAALAALAALASLAALAALGNKVKIGGLPKCVAMTKVGEASIERIIVIL